MTRFARVLSTFYHVYPTLGGRWLPVLEDGPEGLWVEVRPIGRLSESPERVRVDPAHFEIAD